MLQIVQENLPNVPVQGWLVMKNKTDGDIESGSSVYPGILDIEYRNNYWQIFKIYDSDSDSDLPTIYLLHTMHGNISI